MVWEAGGAGVDQSKEALRIKCKHVYSFASYKTKKKKPLQKRRLSLEPNVIKNRNKTQQPNVSEAAQRHTMDTQITWLKLAREL